MDKKKSIAASSSSSSSSFDHIFGPKISSSSSSSSSGLFQSIFPPHSTGMMKMQADLGNRHGVTKYEPLNETGEKYKNKEKSSYQNEETQVPCSLSSSIYYGGQDHYSSSPTTNPNLYKKDEEEEDSKCALRGNWWEGSLYY